MLSDTCVKIDKNLILVQGQVNSNFTSKMFVFSRTPDRDFRCFYPCEIFLSYSPVPALGKDKKTNSSTLASHWPHVDT